MATPDHAMPAKGVMDQYGSAPVDEATVSAEAIDVGLLVMEYLVALVAANVSDAASPNQKVLLLAARAEASVVVCPPRVC